MLEAPEKEGSSAKIKQHMHRRGGGFGRRGTTRGHTSRVFPVSSLGQQRHRVGHGLGGEAAVKKPPPKHGGGARVDGSRRMVGQGGGRHDAAVGGSGAVDQRSSPLPLESH